VSACAEDARQQTWHRDIDIEIGPVQPVAAAEKLDIRDAILGGFGQPLDQLRRYRECAVVR
jgi:hypothetical protein